MVSEKNGAWGQAIEVAGALNAGAEQPGGGVASVSCTSAGNCAAGGSYGYPYRMAFVINEKNGVWGKAIYTGPPAQISDVGSVSCASPGNCVAAGRYFDGNGTRGFVVSEKNGVWGKAITVAGAGSVSCAPAGSCAAVGGYKVQGS